MKETMDDIMVVMNKLNLEEQNEVILTIVKNITETRELQRQRVDNESKRLQDAMETLKIWNDLTS